MIGTITTRPLHTKQTRPLRYLKYKLTIDTKVDAFVKSIWLPNGSNYLIFSGNSPGLTC